MKEILLSGGLIALVDAADYDRAVAAGPWHAKPGGRTVYAHRNVQRADGAWTTQKLHVFIAGSPYVDHRNGDGLDNQGSNLRPTTKKENAANARIRADSRTGFKGVGLHGPSGRWRARVMCDGRSRHLGLFDNPEDAARAYDAAAIELFGEFARPNFPPAPKELAS